MRKKFTFMLLLSTTMLFILALFYDWEIMNHEYDGVRFLADLGFPGNPAYYLEMLALVFIVIVGVETVGVKEKGWIVFFSIMSIGLLLEALFNIFVLNKIIGTTHIIFSILFVVVSIISYFILRIKNRKRKK